MSVEVELLVQRISETLRTAGHRSAQVCIDYNGPDCDADETWECCAGGSVHVHIGESGADYTGRGLDLLDAVRNCLNEVLTNPGRDQNKDRLL